MPTRSGLSWSTWGWLTVTLAVLFLVIVPGTQPPPQWSLERLEHGWPFTFVVRERDRIGDSWAITEDLVEFSPAALAADIAIATLILLLVARWAGRHRFRFGRELWRRRAKLQFGMRFLFGATLAIALALAGAVDNARVREAEAKFDRYSGVVPYWKRPWMSLWQRIYGVYPSYVSDYGYGMFAPTCPANGDQAVCFRYMIHAYPRDSVLTIDEPFTDAQMRHRSAVADVQSIIVEDARPENLVLLRDFHEVRWLFIRQSGERVMARREPFDALANLSQMRRIERLYVFGEHIDDAELGHLQHLKNLTDVRLTWLPGNYADHEWRIWQPVPQRMYVNRRDAEPAVVESRITDEGLAHLQGLHYLERLELDGTRITGPGLVHLHGLPRLRHLELPKAPITDAGLVHLNGCRQLVVVDLRGTLVTTLESLDLENLPRLRQLNLSDTEVSPRRLKQLRREHPEIEIIHSFYDNLESRQWRGSGYLYGGVRMNETMMQQVARASSVRKLILGNSEIDDGLLGHIAGMRELTTLDVKNSRITDAGLAHLERLTDLRQLYLSETSVSDLAPLSQLTALEGLWLSNSRVNDAGLACLCNFEHLQTLDLRNTPITDAGLSHLAALHELETLDLSGTQISDQGLLHLACLTKVHQLNLQRTQVTSNALPYLASLQLASLAVDSTFIDSAATAQLKTWALLPQISLYHPEWSVARRVAEEANAAIPFKGIFHPGGWVLDVGWR